MSRRLNQPLDSLTEVGAAGSVSAPQPVAPRWSSGDGNLPGQPPAAPPVLQGPASAAPPDPQVVATAVARINSKLLADGQALELSVDSSTRQRVIVVRDSTTGTVIRQIPDEEVLRIASALESEHPSVMLDQKA